MLVLKVKRAHYTVSDAKVPKEIPGVVSVTYFLQRNILRSTDQDQSVEVGTPKPGQSNIFGYIELLDSDICEKLFDLTVYGVPSQIDLVVTYAENDGSERVKVFSRVIFGAIGDAFIQSLRFPDDGKPIRYRMPFIVSIGKTQQAQHGIFTAINAPT